MNFIENRPFSFRTAPGSLFLQESINKKAGSGAAPKYRHPEPCFISRYAFLKYKICPERRLIPGEIPFRFHLLP